MKKNDCSLVEDRFCFIMKSFFTAIVFSCISIFVMVYLKIDYQYFVIYSSISFLIGFSVLFIYEFYKIAKFTINMFIVKE